MQGELENMTVQLFVARQAAQSAEQAVALGKAGAETAQLQARAEHGTGVGARPPAASAAEAPQGGPPSSAAAIGA